MAGIGVETAQLSKVEDSLRLNGVLDTDPVHTAIVTPRAEGRIVKLVPNVGDLVSAGQVVAIVESEHLHEAQLEHALALKRLAAAEKDLARRRRLASLGAYGKPGIEETRRQESDAAGKLSSAQAEARIAVASVTEAEGRLASASAALEQAEAAAKLAASRLELAQRQAQRSERLLAAELVSRQEHEADMSRVGEANAELVRARAETRAAVAVRTERKAALDSAKIRAAHSERAEATARRQWEIAQQALERGESVFRGGFAESREVAEAEAAVALARVAAEGALDDVQLLGGQPGDNHSIPVPSPIAGRVASRTATLGQTVHTGEPILSIVDNSILVAKLAVFPTDLSRLQVGAPVVLDISGRKIRTTIQQIGEEADPKTRAVPVRARFANPGNRHRPGLPVTATVSGAAVRAVDVPADAVQRIDGKDVVFVPGPNQGEYVVRRVDVGATRNGRTRIVSGLVVGERYVARNAFLVKSQLLKSELAEE